MLRIVLQTVLFLGCLAACLFFSSGRLDWSDAWLFLGTMTIFIVVGVLVVDHDLVVRRTRRGAAAKRWDLVLATVAAFFTFPLTLTIAGLDIQRYHWTTMLPFVVRRGGLAAFVGGYAFALSAMRENRFFETFVRIQKDQGQQVVTSGPYAFLRHPGYAGAILAHASIPFTLGSRWATIPAFCGIMLFVIRTWLEDRTLQEELAGYRQYAKAVRWRLFPGVW